MLTALLLMLFQTTTSPSVAQLMLQTVLALLVPIGGTWIAGQLTKLWPAVANWKDWEKRALFTVYAIVIAGIAHALGINLPEAWGALGSVEVQAALGALGAMLVHRIFNPQPS